MTSEKPASAGRLGTSNTQPPNTTTPPEPPAGRASRRRAVLVVKALALRVLSAGVDSLYASGKLVLRGAIQRDLQRLQASAAKLADEFTPAHGVDAESGAPLDLEAWEELHPLGDTGRDDVEQGIDVPVVCIEGMNFGVMHYGHDRYRWFLRSEYLDLWLNPKPLKTKPAVAVRLRPRLLWSRGAAEAWAWVKRIVGSLAVRATNDPNDPQGRGEGVAVEWSMSRIDLAVDWIGGWCPRVEDNKRLVTRATKKGWHTYPLKRTLKANGEVDETSRQGFMKGSAETGLWIGKAEKMARLYDKTIEIFENTNSPVADWQRNIWGRYGELPVESFDPRSPQEWHVWRLEFELRGAALKTFWVRLLEGKPRVRMTTPELVLRSLPDLWRYCTEGWLRLVDLRSTRKERCPVNAEWAKLSAWPRGEGDAPTPGPRFETQGGSVDLDSARIGVGSVELLTPMMSGCLKSVSAAVGVPRVTPEPTEGNGNAFDEALYDWRGSARKDMKLKILATTMKGWKDEAYVREIEAAALTGGLRPSSELRKRIRNTFESITDDAVDQQWGREVGETRAKIEKRRRREHEVRFDGCDLNDPAIAQEVRLMREGWEKNDREKRNFLAGKRHDSEEDPVLADCG